MKNKILLGIGVVVILGCMLFILTGCGNNDEYNQISNAIGNVDNLYIHSSDNNNPNENTSNTTIDIPVADDNQNKSNGYWFVGQTLTSVGDNWGATNITLLSPNSEGIPTIIKVTNSGKTLDGKDLNGTFTISLRECNEEVILGEFSEERVSIKGEYRNSQGKILLVDIY